MNPPYKAYPKVVPLKLFLDMVSSSSADGTRTLPRIFRGGSVSFRFKRGETSYAVGKSFLTF